MKNVKRTIIPLLMVLFFVLPVFVFAGPGGERSQQAAGPTYPTRPVELLIPMGAGGGLDLASRAISAVIPKYLGQPLTVTLRPGASGVIGTTEIANAAPDGYRLLFGGTGPNTAVPLAQQVPYTRESFVPIAMVNYSPTVLVVPGNSPYHTVQEVVDAINANPGRLNYSTTGPFSNSHIPMAMFLNAYGLLGKVTPIHYDGGGPQLTAVLGGQVDVAAIFPSNAMDHVKTGALRVLALTDTKRIPADDADGVFKDVPTFTELGKPEVVFRMWWSILAPAGIPKEVEMHLRNAFAQLLRDPEFAELFARMGERTDKYMDGPDFKRMWDEEQALIGPIVRLIQQEER